MIPKKKAWLIILVSIFVMSGLASGSVAYFRHVQEKRLRDPNFRLVAIAQRSVDGELLKSGYLAEILGLSVDRPISLLRFDTQKATARLLKEPLFNEVHVSKIKPGTVSVEYHLRKPIAFLGDYSNTALDSAGYLFPFHPFYTPKKLPEMILGSMMGEEIGDNDTSLWGRQLKGPRAMLALELYRYLTPLLNGEPITVKRIDVSKAYSLSYGQRQIVLALEERIKRDDALIIQPQILRLSSANWMQELARYQLLRGHLAQKEAAQPIPESSLAERNPIVIDLRIPHLALFYFD